MNNISPSSPPPVPSIRIHTVDEGSALFGGSELLSTDLFTLYNFSEDGLFPCSQGLQPQYISSNAISHPSTELEDISELPHLSTTNQLYLSGPGYSLPYPAILQEPGASASADRGLSPSTLGSPIPSPTSSFGSSLSPSSLHDSLVLSDSETPLSPSPTTPDHHFSWPLHGLDHQSSDSLALYPFFPNDPVPPTSLGESGPQRPRSRSSPSSRAGPVASKAMLEANGRRRRHPAQHECPECGQTFTALFSLKRHTQSHTGERPFACSIPGCLQRFFNSSDCKRHEKSKKRHKDLLMA